jgi:hypothetical protein
MGLVLLVSVIEHYYFSVVVATTLYSVKFYPGLYCIGFIEMLISRCSPHLRCQGSLRRSCLRFLTWVRIALAEAFTSSKH